MATTARDQAGAAAQPTPEATEPTGNTASAEACRALQTTDPQVLVTVLIAMLLLLPDVQSLKIAGLVEVVRSAQKAADAADRATEAAATLTAHARALSHSSATASVTVTSADTVPPGVDWDADEQSLAEKRRRFLEQS